MIPVDSLGRVTAFTSSTNAQILPTPACYTVTSGSIGTGITVPDTSLAIPAIGYQVQVKKSDGSVLYTYSQPIYPFGTTWSLDTWHPTVSANVTTPTISYSANAPQGRCGTAPAITYTMTAAYSCVHQVWTVISGNGSVTQGGGTLTAPLYLAHDPVQPTEAATKSYVDTQVVTYGTPTTIAPLPNGIVKGNGSTSTGTAARSVDIASLFGATNCGYLRSDGGCDTPSGGTGLLPLGIVYGNGSSSRVATSTDLAATFVTPVTTSTTPTLELSLDAFPLMVSNTKPIAENLRVIPQIWDYYTIKLPVPKVQSVTSITYQLSDGTATTLPTSAYRTDFNSQVARITPAPGTSWPYQALYNPGTIKIRYVTGCYGDGVTVNTCPSALIAAMLLIIGHLYENREASSQGVTVSEVPLGVDRLLAGHKVSLLGFR